MLGGLVVQPTAQIIGQHAGSARELGFHRLKIMTTTTHAYAETNPSMPILPSDNSRVRGRTAYLLLSFPIHLLAFVIGAALVVTGVSTLVLGIGIPILSFTMDIADRFVEAERGMQRRFLSKPMLPRPASSNQSMLRKLFDPQGWVDVFFTLVAWIVSTITFCSMLTWIGCMLGFTYWLWGWTLPTDSHGLYSFLWSFAPFWFVASFYTVVSGIAFVTYPWVAKGLATFQSTVFESIVNSDALRSRVSELETSNQAARTAERTALSRLERDIHDGPQQRLVRTQMDIARAQRAFDQDPEAARLILNSLSQQNQATLDELRALSNGIAPPVLVDRGLQAALVELTSRSAVPTTLEMNLPLNLGTDLETCAYFVVSECLSNVAKHADATTCAVELGTTNMLGKNGVTTALRIEVADDGHGGATISPDNAGAGSGLRGLRSRVAGFGGTLTVNSPCGAQLL